MLVAALDEAIEILEQAGESHWKVWLERDRQLIAGQNASGLAHLLSAFGGMGSFNDLVLGDRESDDRISGLRSVIYRSARDLLHEFRRSRPHEH